MVKKRFVKEVIHFGSSLGVVMDKVIRETINAEEGDRIVFDVVRVLKKDKKDGENT